VKKLPRALFFQVLEHRYVTDDEEAPGGAQRLAFPIAALECRQIELAQGSARIKQARDATVCAAGTLVSRPVFAVTDNPGTLTFVASKCFGNQGSDYPINY
jgi:hypothetical protein